jgi:integrase
MRAGELAALEWPDIDVPFLDPLLPLLCAWRLRHPGRLVFTNMAGAMIAPSSRIFQEVLHRVLEAASFEKVQRNGKERPYVRVHDLRHVALVSHVHASVEVP